MFEQDEDNIHKYQSDVVITGSKKFQIDRDDSEQFVIVVSSVLRKKFIETDILDSSEVYKVLSQIELIMLGMRTPDLAFLTLNEFSDVKETDFFRHQELLKGKSIMEICLSNPDSVKHALANFEGIDEELQGSIIRIICQDDDVRTTTFKEIDLYPK